ncbi:MAG: ATP-binding protein [Nitrospirota bacterium]|nr:ATP-binding protein [Nitrospirota bacterium]
MITHSSTGAGGVGLGLAIGKEIIEAHEGRIWAKNRPDGGAAFTCLLPLRQPQAAQSR